MNENAAPRRRGLRIAAIAASIVVVLAAAGAIVAKSMLTPERLRREIVNAARTGLGVEPAIDDVSLTLLPFGVRLRGVSVPNATADDPPLLAFDEAHLRVSLLPLFARSLVFDEIRFVRPQLFLRRSGERVLLPGTLGAPPSAPAARAPESAPGGAALPSGLTRVAVRSYRLEDGSFRLRTDAAKEDVDLRGVTLSGTLALDEGGSRIATEGGVSLEGLSIAALALYEETLRTMKPELRYRLAYDAAAGTIDIEEASLAAKPLEIAGAGSVHGLPKSPVLDFTVAERRYALAELLPLVPSALIPEGRKPTGRGNVTLGGRFVAHLTDSTRAPEVQGRIELDQVGLGVEGFPESLENLRGAIEARGDSIQVHEITGDFAGEPFELDGLVAHAGDPERLAYDLELRLKASLDVLARSGFAPPEGKLSGRVDADVRARGVGADPARSMVDGTILAENIVFSSPAMRLPVEGGSARITFAGGEARVERLAARIGRSSFEATGTIRSPFVKPNVNLSGSAPLLDLDELFPPPDSAAPAPAHASVPFVAGAWAAPAAQPPLVPVIPPIDMTLQLDVDSLFTGENVLTGAAFRATTHEERAHVDGTFARARLGEVVLHDLTGSVDIEDGRLAGTFAAPRAEAPLVPLTNVKGSVRLTEDRILRLSEVTARLWSGAVSGDATVDLTDLASPAFTIESKASQVQANDLVSSLTPAKNILTGTMDLASKISGKGSVPEAIAKTLSGEGLLQAQSGNLKMGPTVAAIWSALGVEGRSAVDFKDLAAAFRLEDGRIVTRDVVMRGGDADWKAAGAIGFDGALDYDVEVRLSEALSNASRKRIGRDLAAILGGSTGRLTLDLKISGNANSPKVQIDASKLAARAQESARESLQKGIEKGAADLLGRLGGAKGGAADSGADSGAARRPDSTATPVKDLLEGLFKRK